MDPNGEREMVDGKPTRVLVEDADGASSWATERCLTRAGYAVDSCPGPDHLDDGCPLIHEGTCAKIEDADVVLYALGGPGREVLAAERRSFPQRAIVIEASQQEVEELGPLANGCVTLSRFANGQGFTAAVAKAHRAGSVLNAAPRSSVEPPQGRQPWPVGDGVRET